MDENLPKLFFHHPGDLLEFDKPMRFKLLRALKDLREHPEDGVVLTPPRYETSALGDLSEFGCLSWRVHGPYDDEARIVYRHVEGGIEIVAIGPRKGSVCFYKAWTRLHVKKQVRHVRRDHRRQKSNLD